MRRGVLALLVALVLPGCASGSGAAIPPSPADELTGELVVFAAASLQGTFTQLGELFTTANPGVDVTFNFGSSGTLAQQLVAGAPADVFASANTSTMADAGVTDSTVFTHNSLVIVVPAGNPAGIIGLADLGNPGLTIALCDPTAPCGSAADEAVTAAGVTAAPDTFGQDVKATLAFVTAGEVDAALVYRTDAIAAGDAVETIPFPEAAGAVNDYPIAALEDAPNKEAAAAFVDLVLSPQGQRVLAAAGFGAG